MKRANRFLQKAVVFAFVACSLLFVADSKPALAAETIKIGTVISMSGWAGFIGGPQKEVFDAFIENVNKKGGLLGRQLEVLIEDDQSSPTKAVIAATKLIKDKKVDIIIGPSTTDSGMAMLPICEKEGIPFIITGPVVAPPTKWVFVVGPGDTRGAEHTLDYAIKDMGAKKIALLHGADAYGSFAAKVILKAISKYPGVSIVAQEKFEPADTNMIPQLTKAKASNPDVIMLYTTFMAASIVAKNYKQLGMNIPVLGSNAITMPDFLKLAGPTAEEAKWIFMTQPFIVAEKMAPTERFRKDLYDPFKAIMQAKFGANKQLSLFHGSTWDGLLAMEAAVKLAGKTDRAALRDALEKVHVYAFLGTFEPTPDDHQGSHKDPMVPVVIKNGDWAPYTK